MEQALAPIEEEEEKHARDVSPGASRMKQTPLLGMYPPAALEKNRRKSNAPPMIKPIAGAASGPRKSDASNGILNAIAKSLGGKIKEMHQAKVMSSGGGSMSGLPAL